MSHTMKLWEKVIESIEEIRIVKNQFGFMPRSTKEGIFCKS